MVEVEREYKFMIWKLVIDGDHRQFEGYEVEIDAHTTAHQVIEVFERYATDPDFSHVSVEVSEFVSVEVE